MSTTSLLLPFLACFVILGSCAEKKLDSTAKEASPAASITLTNSSSIDRVDAQVVIPRSQFESSFGDPTQFSLRLTGYTKALPYQLDDMDGDGQWDELAFVANFKSNQSLALTIDTNNASETFQSRAHARLGYSSTRNDTFKTVRQHQRPMNHQPQSKPWLYQFEGPGWESDKIAFRAYFDDRNGKDIFGKKTSNMILEQIGLPMNDPTGNYHQEREWGMDVLKVGPSLGAGALALVVRDSLIRLSHTATANYTLIADGPIRAIIRLNYTGWKIKDQTVDLEEQITIWAGSSAYHSRVTLSDESLGKIATGFVTMKTEKQTVSVEKEGVFAVYSYDTQSENHDNLGMALICKDTAAQAHVAEEFHSDIQHTQVLTLSDSKEFWFLAGWEKGDPVFATELGFQKTLEEYMIAIGSPIEVE